ncbi:mitochondrial 54S ribosomal protein mrpl1 [Saitozyma podzolica]|uniref:Mitochondrial 54S ribosomal protein mrpl1 n=1 Tax=Saitozyma podzolica TaxID=1890683 RepID=A0A427Y7D8_9TREE|nr:mitochondrial 54S ribosomal protein mrpl1 [Saitozyma podzolica]
MSSQSPPHHTHTSDTSSWPSSTPTQHHTKPSRSSSSPSQHDPSQPRSRHRQQSRSRPRPRPRPPLEAYFHEQSKLFSHLQKQFDKFNVRAKDEKARARKERNRPATAPKPVKQAKPRSKSSKVARESVKSVEQPVRKVEPLQEEAKADTNEMIGLNAGNALRGAVRNGVAVSRVTPASTSRAISSTAVSSAKAAPSTKKGRAPVNPDAMNLSEAVRVLRALEIANPSSAYSLTLNTRQSKSSLPLRGRVALPTDARRSPEVILVFADPSSPSADIARSAGAAFVGGEELFPQVLSGEIAPTKVLATPGMMGAVQSKLARFLGPKGLMPVAKRGGVGEGDELAQRIKEAGGLMEWKADKLGVVRAPIARMPFPIANVDANVRAFINTVRESSLAAAAAAAEASNSRKRPPSGIIVARLETTNGPSIELND